MATAEPIPNLPVPTSNVVPDLETGDHLSRDEFERRYHAMPESCHAQLIEGVVYMASPVRFNAHARPHKDLLYWSSTYEIGTPGILSGDNATVRMDLDNEPQPDLAMFLAPGSGGRVKLSDDDYLVGAPEFVAEISASSVSIDLHSKMRVYKRNQVLEYLVWRTLDREIDWFHLQGSDYRRIKPDVAGVLRSILLPGLWLDAPAMFSGDMTSVLKVLAAGLASPEHAAFVERLKNQKTP